MEHRLKIYKVRCSFWSKADVVSLNGRDYLDFPKNLLNDTTWISKKLEVELDTNWVPTEESGMESKLHFGSPFDTLSRFSTYCKRLPFKRLSYFEILPVFQGLALPLKIRPWRNSGTGLPATAYPQTETGLSFALAGGAKLCFNLFHPKKDIFKKNVQQISITPGWYLGVGGVDLDKDNTWAPIDYERKAATVSTGGFLMLGYNIVNIGYSFGFDWATGPAGKNWVRGGELWHGITIGLDIVK